MRQLDIMQSKDVFISSIREAADVYAKVADRLYTLAGDASAMTEEEFKEAIPTLLGKTALAMREITG